MYFTNDKDIIIRERFYLASARFSRTARKGVLLAKIFEGKST